jgi:uncharacterized protein
MASTTNHEMLFILRSVFFLSTLIGKVEAKRCYSRRSEMLLLTIFDHFQNEKIIFLCEFSRVFLLECSFSSAILTTMINQIFLNLPVKDLKKSMDFFSALGLTFNTQFMNDQAACLVIGDNIFAMLITEPVFSTFTHKPLCNAKKHTEAIFALQVPNKEEVDTLMKKAIAAGGVEYKESEDHGWMFIRRFEDLDGHQWEVFCMDETKMPPTP